MSNVIDASEKFYKPDPVYVDFKRKEKMWDAILEEERVDIQMLLIEFAEQLVVCMTEKDRISLFHDTARKIQQRTL